MIILYLLTICKDFCILSLPMLQAIRQTIAKELISTISSKGQVTLPISVRRYLGLQANDKVAFVIESNGMVKVAPARYPDIASLKGAAGSLNKPLDWKEMKRIAYEDRLKNKYGK